MSIKRQGKEVFAGSLQLIRMKRNLPELAGYLFREMNFSTGCYLMTGTGIVPPDDFTLAINDEVIITIEHIGTLRNVVGQRVDG